MNKLAKCRLLGRLFYWPLVMAMVMGSMAGMGWASPAKTTINDTLYRADGTAAQGTLLISWPAFTTSDGQAVAAGSMSLKLGAAGEVNVALVANTGSIPASSYKVTLRLDSGASSEEYWVVPQVAMTTVAAIRSKIVPLATASQLVGRDYLDTRLAQIATDSTGVIHQTGAETVSGVKQFTVSPKVPSPVSSQDAANKQYVDGVMAPALVSSGAYADPQWLSSLNATKLTGTVADAAIPTTVARVGSPQTWTGAQTFGTLSAKKVNGVLMADQYAGLDACVKIKAAIADLPAKGGKVDASGLQGAQNCSVDPLANVNGPVHLYIGAATITSTVGWTLPSGLKLEGMSKEKSALDFQGVGGTIAAALTANGSSNVEISNLTLSSESARGAVLGISVTGNSTGISIHDNLLTKFGMNGTFGFPMGAVYLQDTSDIWVVGNEFTANGPTTTLKNSFDIVSGYLMSSNTRLHIRNNYIHGSNTDISIALFDTNYTEVEGNTIDQNNQMHMPTGPITGIFRASGVVTVTVGDASQIYAGGDTNSTVTITGVTDSGFNGVFTPVGVTGVDGTHFRYPQSGSDTSSTGGNFKISANNDGYGIMCYTSTLASTTTACHHNRIENNTIKNAGGIGILLQGSPYTTVAGNNLFDTDKLEDGGSHPVGAIAVNAGNAGALFSEGVSISGNVIDTTWRSGIDINQSKNISVTGNTLRNIGTSGGGNASCIRLRDTEPNAVISGNSCQGGVKGIFADGSPVSPTITGNALSGWGGSGGAGIYLQGNAVDGMISGNTITNPSGAGQGILIMGAAAARNLIANNTINLVNGSISNAIDYRGISGRIANNSVTNSPQDGINITSASETAVEHNSVTSSAQYGVRALNGTTTFAVTNTVLTANSAIYTVASTTGIVAGRRVLVTGSTHDPTFNGVFTITSVAPTTFTVGITHGAITTAADTATATITFGNVVRNNVLLGNAVGALSGTNLLTCSGNETDAVTGYDFGNASCVTVATVDSTGKATMNGGLSVASSVSQNTGLKHGRVTTGSIAAAGSAAVTLTWGGSAFADTNYTVSCSVVDATAATAALHVDHVQSVTTTTVVARVSNTAAGALTGWMECVGMHD